MKFNHLGSLITCEDNGIERCLGYLFAFDGKGVLDPTLGKVDVSPEHVAAHNVALDQALLEGLDKNCAIGQGGTFYFVGGKVKTFCGTVVDDSCWTSGKTVTTIHFRRGRKFFRGRLQKHAECFNFRRVA